MMEWGAEVVCRPGEGYLVLFDRFKEWQKASCAFLLLVLGLWMIFVTKYDWMYNKLMELSVDPISNNTDQIADLTRLQRHLFDPKQGDMFVMIHIQKTGGTIFTKNLVHYLDTGYPCKCKQSEPMQAECPCLGPHGLPWLRSMYQHRQVNDCDMHIDWTMAHKNLFSCLSLKYNYNITPKSVWITQIRDPVYRYISEWNVVANRGSNWNTENRECADFHPVSGHVERCPFPEIQREARRRKRKPNITFDYFMECPGNLANNRQTRMLANRTDLHCSNVNLSSTFETMQRRMLESAKRNLAQLHFFGLTEYQKENQILFENTFGLKFRNPGLVQLNSSAQRLKSDMKKHQLERLKKLNLLDIELYNFGKKIFFSRFKTIRPQ